MAELTFTELQRQSASRRDHWHGPDTEPWTGADWSNAMCGEAGEAANIVKKIRRGETRTHDMTVEQRDQLIDALATELGDVIAYAVLVADHYGIDLGAAVAAVAAKFNQVSRTQGFPERLPEPIWTVEDHALAVARSVGVDEDAVQAHLTERDPHVVELEAAIDRIRKLHPEDDGPILAPGQWCPHCGHERPCPSIRSLKGTS